MSLERRAAGEVFGHHAFGVRGRAPGLRRRLRIVLRSRPSAMLRAEGFVEVGADDAFGVRARERVAGAALGDELLLADDQVGVVVALDRATAARRPAAGHRSRRAGRACAGFWRWSNEDIGGETLSEGQATLAPVGVSARRSARVRAVSTSQRYRLRNPASGREIVIEAEPERDLPRPRNRRAAGGRRQAAAARALASRLPWAVENLRFCPWCDQLAQKDLNDCPTCGRRMGPLGSADGSRLS